MITIYPVTVGVTASALPANAAEETAGQLQRCADALERLIVLTRTQNQLLAQLSEANTDDPDSIEADLTNISYQ